MKSEMKKEFLRKKLVVNFHFRRHVVLFPQALGSNIDREELGMIFSEGGKWSEVGSGVVQDYFTA